MARITSKAVVAPVNAVGAYVAALLDLQTSARNCAALALDLVSECTTVESLNVVRDSFKAEYATQYQARNPTTFDAEKCKNASNMAWSRTCANAKDLGYVRPVAETAGAQKARDARAKAGAGKVDGRTTKTKLSTKVAGILSDNEELMSAFASIAKDATLAEAFLDWFEAETAAPVVPVRQVRSGRVVKAA